MKTKSFLSLIALLLYSILACASDEFLDPLYWLKIILVSIIIVAVYILLKIGANRLLNRGINKKKLLENKRMEETKAQYIIDRAQLISQKGEPDKTIIIKESDLNSEIRVYESIKKIDILGKEYEFNDIISCNYTDSPRTIKGQITAETKSKTGSAVGRAIVGDLVAGPAGAIIGGTTGKKNTVFHQEDDTIEHNFTVYINVNSISNPVVSINTGDNSDLTNEIYGLIKVIISRK